MMTQHAVLYDSDVGTYFVIAKDAFTDWYITERNLTCDAATDLAEYRNAKENRRNE